MSLAVSLAGPVAVCMQVRESSGANSKQSPFYEDLLKAQEAAQAGNKGLWTKVRPQPRQLHQASAALLAGTYHTPG